MAKKKKQFAKPPMTKNELQKWFATLDKFSGEALLKDGRKQPLTPKKKIF